jgi:hypothetical protein
MFFIKIGALVALPFLLAFSILVLALALIGEAFALPFGGGYLTLVAAMGGVTPGNGLRARHHVLANASRILWGPLIWAAETVGPMWNNLGDLVLGPENRPSALPPGQYYRELPPDYRPRPPRRSRSQRALPPGRSY